MLELLKKAISPRHPLRIAWHRCKAFVAAVRYGFPARRLTVIGITGTDGKTTTVGMTAHILNRCGNKAGALSTAFFQVGDDITFNATQKTSPSPFTVQRFLRRCLREGCTHVVLEVSSHGLDQGRVDWTFPDVAAITNLAEEHLDYHGSMEDYAATKRKLFLKLRGCGTKVLNADDRTFASYNAVPSASTVLTSVTRDLGASPRNGRECSLCVRSLTEAVTGCTATVQANVSDAAETTFSLSLGVPGAFNVANALIAMGCAHACGIGLADAASSLAQFHGVPGRMERIDCGQPFSVIVDFTVTPQSYERTLSTIKRSLSPGKRLLVLTGSCGDRMKEKRPVVGRLCGEYADMVVVTNEDPYTEDPQSIIDQVFAGIDVSQTQAKKIFDRKEAITFLLSEAKEGDVVLLCGKGSDTTMWVKEGQVPWNEREMVRSMLVQK